MTVGTRCFRVLLILLSVAAGHRPTLASAQQQCDPAQSRSFVFSSATGIAALTVKSLQPPSPNSRVLQGTGTLTLLDGTTLPLAAKARHGLTRSTPRRDVMTYLVKGRAKPLAAQGTVVVEGCPGTITRVRISVSRGRGLSRLKVRDPADVGSAALASMHTRVLEQGDVVNLYIDPADRTTLTLPSTDPLASSLVPGTVLVAGRTATTPRGLLRKVVQVLPGTLTTTILTVPATLTDAFDTLDLEFGVVPGAQSFTSQPRPRLSLSACVDAGADLPVQKTLAGDHGSVVVSGDVGATGQLCLGGHIKVNWGIPPTLDVQSLYAEAIGQFSGSIGIEADAALSLDYEDVQIGEGFDLPAIDTPIPAIVITPSLELDGTVTGRVDGKVSATASTSLTIDVGFLANTTGFHPIAIFTPQLSDNICLSAGASFSTFVGPDLHITVDDSDIVSGDIHVGPYADLTAKIDQDPWFSLTGGLQVGIDVSVALLGDPYSNTFQYFQQTFAQAPGFFDCSYSCDAECTTTTTSTSSTSSTESSTTTTVATTTSTLPSGLCGDGFLDSGEDCDDGAGNGTVGTCCAGDCTFQPNGTHCFIDGFGPGQCNGAQDGCIFTIF